MIMRRILPLMVLLLASTVVALAEDKPVPPRPSAAATLDLRLFRYETLQGWNLGVDLGGLWRPKPDSRQSLGGMMSVLHVDDETSAAIGPAYEVDMAYGKRWSLYGASDIGYIVGDANKYATGVVDFKTGVRWAGTRFAPKVSLALRKALAEEEGAGEKIDTFGINFGFEIGK
jgi:hypothetical protein